MSVAATVLVLLVVVIVALLAVAAVLLVFSRAFTSSREPSPPAGSDEAVSPTSRGAGR